MRIAAMGDGGLGAYIDAGLAEAGEEASRMAARISKRLAGLSKGSRRGCGR
jgi:hypothetical protein